MKSVREPKVGEYPGAVSIFVKDTTMCSKFKKNIIIFGSTTFKKKLLPNYVNLEFNRELFKSGSKMYIQPTVTGSCPGKMSPV